MSEPEVELLRDDSEWDRLQAAQRDLFNGKVDQIKELQAAVKELQSQVTVYQNAYSGLVANFHESEARIAGLETTLREVTTNVKIHNTCAIAAIDGDGYPFAPKYIQGGRRGGQEAATDLNSKLTADIGTEARLIVFVYVNKQGLVDALMKHKLLKSSYVFDEFMRGFNQASPLFHMVDVGPGKEAADSKLRELCTYFARTPQTTKIYFAGAHDAGYATFLRSIRTEGFSDKFVLLRSSVPFAREMTALGLIELDLSSVFGGGDLSAISKALGRASSAGGSGPSESSNVQHRPEMPGEKVNAKGARMLTKAEFIVGKNCYHFHFASAGCHLGQNCHRVHDSSIGDRLHDIRKEGYASFQEFFQGKRARPPDASTSRATLLEGISNQSRQSSTPSAVAERSSLPGGLNRSPSVSVSSKDNPHLEPPSTSYQSIAEFNSSPLVPLVNVLVERLVEGQDRVQWSLLGSDLKALDQGYLGKNGAPTTFKAFMALAEAQQVVLLDMHGADLSDVYVSLHPRMAKMLLGQAS